MDTNLGKLAKCLLLKFSILSLPLRNYPFSIPLKKTRLPSLRSPSGATTDCSNTQFYSCSHRLSNCGGGESVTGSLEKHGKDAEYRVVCASRKQGQDWVSILFVSLVMVEARVVTDLNTDMVAFVYVSDWGEDNMCSHCSCRS